MLKSMDLARRDQLPEIMGQKFLTGLPKEKANVPFFSSYCRSRPSHFLDFLPTKILGK